MCDSNLWEFYRNNKTIEARNRLLLHYAPVVNKVVKMMPYTYMGYVDEDDLISYGIFGLIDAIDKFDVGKRVKFETYASLRIRGAILDQLRKMDFMSRNTRKKLKLIEENNTSFEKELARKPSYEELSTVTGLSVKNIKKVMEESMLDNMISFENTLCEKCTPIHASSKEESPEDEYIKKETSTVLKKAIEKLNEKEQIILDLYYYQDLNLKEIGESMQLSESRISQLLSGIMCKLKKTIENS